MESMNPTVNPPMNIAPYSAPNSLDTVIRLEQRLCRRLPDRLFRMAEILACLQTLDDAVCEMRDKSPRRNSAADSWRELAGDLLFNIPVLSVRGQDPFRVARADFPASACPQRFAATPEVLLAHMATAANAAIGSGQRYADNYHGVIAYQLARLGLMTRDACAEFHREVLRLPMPEDHERSCLVYPPDYSADHLPRGSEDHFDLSDYPNQSIR